jgi:hypothetical protein
MVSKLQLVTLHHLAKAIQQTTIQLHIKRDGNWIVGKAT